MIFKLITIIILFILICKKCFFNLNQDFEQYYNINLINKIKLQYDKDYDNYVNSIRSNDNYIKKDINKVINYNELKNEYNGNLNDFLNKYLKNEYHHLFNDFDVNKLKNIEL